MKFRNLLFLIALFSISFNFIKADVIEGKDYVVLNQPIDSIHPDQIELVEAFSYNCIHCQHFNPSIEKYVSQLPNDIVFRQIHVYWASHFINLIRLNIAVNDSQMRPLVNQYIFSAILNEQINLSNEKETIHWLKSQTHFDANPILAYYQTKKNKHKAQEMAELTTKYHLESTPTIIVGSKYKIKLEVLKTEADFKRILDGLIELARRDKKPIKTVYNSGAEFAYQANLISN